MDDTPPADQHRLLPLPRDQRPASRCFTLSDQLEFARLSGDYNPVHIDEIAARRTLSGEPLVHGVHSVIWTLDALAAIGLPIAQIKRLNVRFTKFLFLDTPIEIRVQQLPEKSLIRVRLVIGNVVAGLVVMYLVPQRAQSLDVRLPSPVIDTLPETPNAPTLPEMANLAGRLLPPSPASEWSRLYPHGAAALTAQRLSGLAQLSRLVGMVCPGLHSIFTGFTVDLVDDILDDRGIVFRTTVAEPQLRVVQMSVLGSGLSGTVSSFVRWPPVETPSMAAIRAQIARNEFVGSTALVVGGSRGLGAVTAKLLAAGGSRVVITYARGAADAENLAGEINTACGEGTCRATQLDARGEIASQLAFLSEKITHLYYFATPQIYRQKSEVYSAHVYKDFNRIYIDAFAEICRFLLLHNEHQSLSVFYPSSVFVEERPVGMTEYGMAKIAAEILCADMMRDSPGLTILVSRLPRVLTDQTATAALIDAADPCQVLLPLVRQVQACNPAGSGNGG